MVKIPVRSIYDNLEMMHRDKWGYIYGTAGEMWTAEKQKSLESRYSEDDPNYGMSVRYGSQWIGHVVTDCSGVEVKIWKDYGLSIPHGSSSMVRQGYIVDCGSVAHPGWAALIDPTPDTPDNNHIGIVSEDGMYVYEAKGARYGFVKTKLADSKFKKFGRFKDVDYSDSGEVKEMEIPYYAEVTTQSGKLNVRSGPDTEYGKIGTVAKGETVVVKSHGADWDFINYNGLQGYVSNQYLKPLEEIHDDTSPDQGENVVTIPLSKLKELVNEVQAVAFTLNEIAKGVT